MPTWLQLVLVSIASGSVGAIAGALMNASAAKKLATQTAKLARGTNLHQVQVEHLCKLGRLLFEATENGRTLSAGFRLRGDPPEQEIAKSFVGSLSSAYGEYLDCRLLLPREVAKQVEAFFLKMQGYRLQLGGVDVTPAGHEHAEAFRAAQRTANQEIPPLLETIDAGSRRIIGTES